MVSSDRATQEESIHADDGFMGFWADIEHDYVLRYQEWHSCEHIPERLSIPGFVEGRRYRSVSSGSTFFMCYETASPQTLRSKAYLAALDRPTPWTQEALKRFRNPKRNIYRKISSAERAIGGDPYLVVQRFDSAHASRDMLAVIAGWMRDAQIAGPLATSLYEIDIAASTIMTAERAIYAGGAGEQGYLLTLGLKDRATADVSMQRLTKGLSKLEATSLEGGIYWLETRLRADDIARSDAVRQQGAS